MPSSLDSFSEIFTQLWSRTTGSRRGGGRRPQESDEIDIHSESSGTTSDDGPVLPDEGVAAAAAAAAGTTIPHPVKVPLYLQPLRTHKGERARLTIVQITDVYTLDYFPHLRTFLRTLREAQGADTPNNKVISMLTGDFLAPYLLSSVDGGRGMMQALKATPVDILTWGNHEADIDHRTVCRHVKDWYQHGKRTATKDGPQGGIWINSNMQSHEAMEYQVPYHIVEMSAPGQPEQTFRVGFIAVLSSDPKLYSQFKAPGAFGGATIEDPWETLRHYEQVLRNEKKCDLIIPLEHLYVHENRVTCEQFGPDVFPVILSGHDHHRIDTKVEGTRLIKPGMDAVYATVLEIVFRDDKAAPTIRSNFVELATYEPDAELKAQTDAAYDVLLPLRNTQLADILPQFKPLSSQNARGSLTTMGKLICSMLKAAMEQTVGNIDAVMLMGGNIRANQDYDDDAFFSLETLEAEIKSDEVVGIVDMPGHVLAAGIEATHSGAPIPGWFQYDDGIGEIPASAGDGETHEYKTKVVTVNNRPIEPDRIYRVVTKIKDLTNGQSPPLKEYYTSNPNMLPSKGEYYNIHSELMGFFARGLFRKLWEATEEYMQEDPWQVWEEASHPPPPISEVEGRLRHAVLDRDGDGNLTIDDIHVGLRDFLGLSVNDDVKILAQAVHECADVTGDGRVTVRDFKIFCTKMPREYRLPRKWSNAFPDPLPTPAVSETGTDASPTTVDPVVELEDFHQAQLTAATEKKNHLNSKSKSESETTLAATETDSHAYD